MISPHHSYVHVRKLAKRYLEFYLYTLAWWLQNSGHERVESCVHYLDVISVSICHKLQTRDNYVCEDGCKISHLLQLLEFELARIRLKKTSINAVQLSPGSLQAEFTSSEMLQTTVVVLRQTRLGDKAKLWQLARSWAKIAHKSRHSFPLTKARQKTVSGKMATGSLTLRPLIN